MEEVSSEAWFYACHDVSEGASCESPTTMTLIDCEDCIRRREIGRDLGLESKVCFP